MLLEIMLTGGCRSMAEMSEPAQHLVRKLTAASPKQRGQLRECLCNPWVVKDWEPPATPRGYLICSEFKMCLRMHEVTSRDLAGCVVGRDKDAENYYNERLNIPNMGWKAVDIEATYQTQVIELQRGEEHLKVKCGLLLETGDIVLCNSRQEISSGELDGDLLGNTMRAANFEERLDDRHGREQKGEARRAVTVGCVGTAKCGQSSTFARL